MSDDNNPIITCTSMQLAFVAWQIKRRGQLHNFATIDLDLDKDGPGGAEFRAWYDGHDDGWCTSLRDMCWQAWRDARHLNEPNHGDLNHFNAWFQTIIDAQPVIGQAAP